MGRKEVFEGIHVLDFGVWIVWPFMAKHLGDFGAEVVRIEFPRRLPERMGRPAKDGVVGPNRAGYFALANTSKYSMLLDAKNPKAQEVLRRLVAWADVVGEGYVPGVVKGWGFDYESCRKIKPDIIYVSSSGQGQWGPDAHLPMFGHVVLGASGMSEFMGYPDGPPIPAYGPWTDYLLPYIVLTIVAAALDRRRRTGRGMYIDLAGTEGALYSTLEANILDYTVNKRLNKRMGNRHPYAAPHGTYLCQGGSLGFPPEIKDGLPVKEMDERWVSIAVFTDEEWQNFCKVIGEPEWTKDPKFATLMSRKRNEDELDRLIGEWTKNYSPEDVMYMMQAAGVAAGVVQTSKDIAEDAQLRHRNHAVLVEHKEVGPTYFENHSFRLPKCPAKLRPAPCVGEHNEYVLKNFLGMSDEEILELVSADAFE